VPSPYKPGCAIRSGQAGRAWHGLLNWTNGLAHSIAEKAVSSRERRANPQREYVGTNKIAADVGINR